MTGNGAPGRDPASDDRRRLIAKLLRRALAEQRRICVLDCIDFPDDSELLGRDLSLMTLVAGDVKGAAKLRHRFGEAIVIETGPPSPFLARCHAMGERFDMIMLPSIGDRLSNAALSALLREISAGLNRGGYVVLIGNVPASGMPGRTLGDLVQIFESSTSPFHVTVRREVRLAVLAGQLSP